MAEDWNGSQQNQKEAASHGDMQLKARGESLFLGGSTWCHRSLIAVVLKGQRSKCPRLHFRGRSLLPRKKVRNNEKSYS